MISFLPVKHLEKSVVVVVVFNSKVLINYSTLEPHFMLKCSTLNQCEENYLGIIARHAELE